MKPGTALDFETLVGKYYQPVFTLAVKLCGQLDRALELTQHTFCLALNHESYFGGTQSAKSWLFTLLFREFLKERRLEGVSTSSIIPQGRCTKQAASTPILAALTKVRKELQAPLILFYAKDFSFSQIADYLGISVDAVLTLLSKGREELSLALAPIIARGSRPLDRSSEHTQRPGILAMAA
jgi:RNA polymerase sigma-70 factor (ECF subfamily)